VEEEVEEEVQINIPGWGERRTPRRRMQAVDSSDEEEEEK